MKVVIRLFGENTLTNIIVLNEICFHRKTPLSPTTNPLSPNERLRGSKKKIRKHEKAIISVHPRFHCLHLGDTFRIEALAQ
jgi:hypothetical protein